jgi:hypothetical protein
MRIECLKAVEKCGPVEYITFYNPGLARPTRPHIFQFVQDHFFMKKMFVAQSSGVGYNGIDMGNTGLTTGKEVLYSEKT